MNYGYDDILNRALTREDREEIEGMVLTPRDEIALGQMQQSRDMAERLGSPAEATLRSIRRATDQAAMLRSELNCWKALEERERFERSDVEEKLKGARGMIRTLLVIVAAETIVGVMYLGARLWR